MLANLKGEAYGLTTGAASKVQAACRHVRGHVAVTFVAVQLQTCACRCWCSMSFRAVQLQQGRHEVSRGSE